MHFTYSETEVDKTILRQGDLLTRTSQLVAVLSEFHAYFAHEHYTHFLVLTQSCDLVGTPPKSRYITLAAVRSFGVFVEQLVRGLPTTTQFLGDTYCSESNKGKLTDPISKLLNNNHSGCFYLKAEPDRGLKHDSCAFLQLSIPIRSDKHYATCADAKCLELSEGFRAKLGWLVGNLYSRVGTKDYIPGTRITKANFNTLLTETIESSVNLVPAKAFARFKVHAKDAASFDELSKKIEDDFRDARRDRLRSLVEKIGLTVPLSQQQQEELTASLSAYGPLDSFLSG